MKKSKKYLAVVCGHHAKGANLADGQTIKTRYVYDALLNRYGSDDIILCDTYLWKKHPIRYLFNCIKSAWQSDNVIILSSDNGIKVFVPLFFLVSLFNSAKLHYVAIGGWQYQYFQKNRLATNIVKRFAGFYSETIWLQLKLESMGFKNVYTIPNFKNLKIIPKTAIPKFRVEPLPLCIFSRINKEKGIEDAINAINDINSQNKRTTYTLDIYGQIEEAYKDRFTQLESKFPDYIQYKGVADEAKSTEMLKDYYMLLFPTRYQTEGIPGTIIDAYSAGLPIISSRWDSFSDIIIEGKTGLGYDMGNYEEFVKLLYYCSKPDNISSYRASCIDEAYKYTSDEALLPLYDRINKESLIRIGDDNQENAILT